jgi:hypothetical protein
MCRINAGSPEELIDVRVTFVSVLLAQVTVMMDLMFEHVTLYKQLHFEINKNSL